MRTNGLLNLRIVLLVGLVALTSAFALQVLASAASAVGPVDASSYRLPAEDRARLADLQFGNPPTSAITADAARGIAAREYDPEALGATSIDAFLETLTVPGMAHSDAPIAGRGVWIIRLAGLSQEQPGPITADGVPAPGHILHRAYIFIDADSGEFLFAEWQE